jgi:hypothetical protein
MPNKESRTIWPSDQGDLRKYEGTGPKVVSLPPKEQTIYLHRASMGRGGCTVTLVRNLVLSENFKLAYTT